MTETIEINGKTFSIYHCKDGRDRCYEINSGRSKVISYPRALMEQKLGRPLEADEDVHHINGNPKDNSLENLTIIKHGQHQREHNEKNIKEGKWKNGTSFVDKEMICPECGKEFLWTAKQQYERYKNKNRKDRKVYNGDPLCSKKCIGKHNQREQMCQKAQAECQ